MPEVGINDYVLKAGDVIEFFYTDDYRPIFGMMPIYGDADNDGILTGSDAAYILQYSNNSSFINADGDWKEKADADGDGVITANDAAMVYQKVLVSTYRFPVEQ